MKSSRGEAYAEFVEEFGPEVELDSLEVVNTEGIKQVQIFPDEASEWFITYDILSSGKEQFIFESSKYGRYVDFVKGMFETEYSERYQELLEMAKGALPQEEQSTNPEYHKISLHVLKRYLDCAEEVQEYTNRRIRSEFSNNTLGQRDALLGLFHPSIIRGISPEFISQQIDIQMSDWNFEGKTRPFLKSVVIQSIALSVVDRTIDHPIVQQFFQLRGSSGAGRLRDGLISEYYDLFMRGILSDDEPSKPRTTTSMSRIIPQIDRVVRRLDRVWRQGILQQED